MESSSQWVFWVLPSDKTVQNGKIIAHNRLVSKTRICGTARSQCVVLRHTCKRYLYFTFVFMLDFYLRK